MSEETTENRPKPLPPPHVQHLAVGITLVNPLSRRGYGPGLIVLVNEAANGISVENGVPSPLMKWAEEGYCVVELLQAAWKGTSFPIQAALDALQTAEKCEPKGAVGLVCYEPSLWDLGKKELRSAASVAAAVLYSPASSLQDYRKPFDLPLLIHLAGVASTKLPRTEKEIMYDYPDQTSPHFATPLTKQFDYKAEAVSHTRSLTFLKKHMQGPFFDLEALWDEHTYYEFEVRSVEDTMNTMVQEPYVNHVPTMTGGIGRRDLTEFYRDHFIFNNPKDTELELVSRTVGIDRVVDEFVFKFTHDMVIDWLFPGVPPTNKYAEIPFVAIVNIRGDRLYHEHISWDQATALKQIGCLHDQLSYDDNRPAVDKGTVVNGKHLKLPIAGKHTAAKLRDKNSVPSNEMFEWNSKKF